VIPIAKSIEEKEMPAKKQQKKQQKRKKALQYLSIFRG
jgi:hypothetical protein